MTRCGEHLLTICETQDEAARQRYVGDSALAVADSGRLREIDRGGRFSEKDLNGGAAEAFYFKGRCARDQGEAALAAEAFAKALQLAPDFKRAARALNNR